MLVYQRVGQIHSDGSNVFQPLFFARGRTSGVGRIFESRALLESQFLGRGLTAIKMASEIRAEQMAWWAGRLVGFGFNGIPCGEKNGMTPLNKCVVFFVV